MQVYSIIQYKIQYNTIWVYNLVKCIRVHGYSIGVHYTTLTDYAVHLYSTLH